MLTLTAGLVAMVIGAKAILKAGAGLSFVPKGLAEAIGAS